MHAFKRWKRSAIVLAAATVVVPAAAQAAPIRTATTTKYTHATFLQHALGLPASDTNPALESVTYDRFQWLLQQSGTFAFVIGDPATDNGFAARAQEIEAKAKAAGVKRVYWFNPNLSGSAKVGTVTEPALDIRKTADIPLAAASQTTYGNAWKNLVGQYLGNGLSVTVNFPLDERQTVKIDASANVNDSDAPIYDYTGGATPATVGDSYFLIYDKSATKGGTPDKIVSSVDLTAKGAAAAADVEAALAGKTFTSLDQFAWWKSEATARQKVTSGSDATGNKVDNLTDADNADGWRIDQVTYPEIVDLLASGAQDADAVILFGGTWCPNTRPVLPAINKYANQNNVQVFNFDTVLDGAAVGGLATSSVNPLQTRNTAANGGTDKANPSYLYGDLVDQYLTNIKTEYDPASNSVVTYYKGGGAAAATTRARKLQVPFLIGYQGKSGDDAHAGVSRQWIIDNGNGSYKEYMSQWWYTNPQPNQLGLSEVQLPQAAPYWQTLNAQVASFKWDTPITSVLPNTTIDNDEAPFLTPSDTATVTFSADGTNVTAASGGASPIPVNGPALTAAQAALGASAPATLAAAKTALLAAKAANQDVSNLSTVFAAYTLARPRKNAVFNAWGNQATAGGIAGGIAAVHAAEVFFGGLPGGVVSRRTVTADTVTAGTAPTITLKIANDYGRKPAGNVALTVKQGGTTVHTASSAVAGDAATFTLPALAAGTYAYTLSYAGDDQVLGFTESGSLTVSPAPQTVVQTPPVIGPLPGLPVTPKPTITLLKLSKVKGAVAKAPTSRKAGKYKVTLTAPKGAAAVTGKVTLKLKKGKTTRTITGKLAKGSVTVSVPKLARGTWKVSIAWPGDAHYQAASATGASIRVTK